MNADEFEFQLSNLPPNTPITIEHLTTMLAILNKQKKVEAKTAESKIGLGNWGDEKLITEEDLSDWIGESVSAIQKWRVKGKEVVGPQFVKTTGKSVRYRVGTVKDWLKSRTVGSTTESRNLKFDGMEFDFIRPMIFHDEKPIPYFKSIELLEDDTNITGFELLLTPNDSLAALYLAARDSGDVHGLIDELGRLNDIGEDIKALSKCIINGNQEQTNLAQLSVLYPFEDNEKQRMIVLDLLEKEVDFTDALAHSDEFCKKIVNSFHLHAKLSNSIRKKD